MKTMALIMFSFGGLFVGAVNVYAQEADLDNERLRPLVLPKNMGEIQVGAGNLYQSNYNNYPIGIFSLAYGVTDNFELSLFGARYRFMHTPDHEMALHAKILSFGYTSSDKEKRWSADTEIGLAGKWRMDGHGMAIPYAVVWRNYDKDVGGDAREMRLAAAFQYGMGKHAVLEVGGTYRNLGQFNESSAWIYNIALYYNLRQNWDIVATASHSTLQRPGGPEYASDAYNNAVSTKLRFRF